MPSPQQVNWAKFRASSVILAGLLILGYVAVRLVQSKRMSSLTGTGPSSDSPARRILDTRYARGEIDAEEYHHRKGLLP